MGFGCAAAGALVLGLVVFTDRLLPYDGSAWYASVQGWLEAYIPTDAGLFILFPFFVLALTLLCEKRYETHVLAGSVQPRAMTVFRLLFALGVTVVTGGTAILSFADFVSVTAFSLWVVTLLMAYGWVVLLSYRVVFHCLQWLAGRVMHSDVRIARRWEGLLSLPYFILVFAIWYSLEIR